MVYLGWDKIAQIIMGKIMLWLVSFSFVLFLVSFITLVHLILIERKWLISDSFYPGDRILYIYSYTLFIFQLFSNFLHYSHFIFCLSCILFLHFSYIFLLFSILILTPFILYLVFWFVPLHYLLLFPKKIFNLDFQTNMLYLVSSIIYYVLLPAC